MLLFEFDGLLLAELRRPAAGQVREHLAAGSELGGKLAG